MTRMLLALFFLASPLMMAHSASEEASRDIVIRPGEIRLDGKIKDLNPSAASLTIEVYSFTLPNGKRAELSTPKPKTIVLHAGSTIRRRADNGKIALSDLKSGNAVIVVGRDSESKNLVAREILLIEIVSPRSAPPACKFLNPKADEAVASDVIRVLLEATDDNEVKDFQFFVNGKRTDLTGARPILPPAKPILIGGKDVPVGHKFSRLAQADLPLPKEEGEVVLKAIVKDDEGNTGETTVRIRRVSVAPPTGDLYVLSVGISRYRNEKYNIGFAEKDAAAFGAMMAEQKGGLYQSVNLKLLTDQQASLANLRSAIQALKPAKAEDTVIVFLCGHGVTEDDKLYFAPWGLFINDVASTCLPWPELIAALAETPATKLLFVDAYHEKSALGLKRVTSKQLLDSMRSGSSIVTMSASGGDEYSYALSGQGHGAFAAALLEALRGEAELVKDGVITLPELQSYVPKRVSELTKGLQNPEILSIKDFSPQRPLVRLK